MEFGRSIIEGVEIKRCRNNPHAYKSHVHNELSIGYIVEGSTNLTLHDRIIFYGSGDGVIIPPLLTHRCVPNDINHWAYVMLFVDPGYYGDLVSFNQAKKLTGNQVRKLIGFIEQLVTEKTPDTVENIVIELLLEFGEKDISETTVTNTRDIAKTIHEYILNHANEVITLNKLQQITGLNKFSIIRNFKKLYVTTPAAYHLQYRVAEAKRLLSKGVDVFDICEELRFYDQAHLIREFKKMYGITPVTYIKQVKE
ncbi:helix-turn-helix transcriptional regulator|nr:helix-turn-helix transcriptional regulator [Dendrosporobacter quercicolus DSM 1736]